MISNTPPVEVQQPKQIQKEVYTKFSQDIQTFKTRAEAEKYQKDHGGYLTGNTVIKPEAAQ